MVSPHSSPFSWRPERRRDGPARRVHAACIRQIRQRAQPADPTHQHDCASWSCRTALHTPLSDGGNNLQPHPVELVLVLRHSRPLRPLACRIVPHHFEQLAASRCCLL